MNNNVDIFICAHKDFDVYPNNDAYTIIHGAEQINIPLKQITEGETDSLINKQQLYGEGSRIYWLWKHVTLKDYIGICHYSKYFDFYDKIPDMDSIFKKYDVILPQPLNVGNVFGQYGTYHNIEDLNIIGQIIYTKHKDYFESFLETMNQGILFCCNMFIMKKEDFEKYCEFVFSVLGEFDILKGFETYEDAKLCVEKNSDKYLKNFAPNNEINYQSRMDGFLLERLTNVFINKHFKKPLLFGIKTTDNKYNKTLFT